MLKSADLYNAAKNRIKIYSFGFLVCGGCLSISMTQEICYTCAQKTL